MKGGDEYLFEILQEMRADLKDVKKAQADLVKEVYKHNAQIKAHDDDLQLLKRWGIGGASIGGIVGALLASIFKN
jgi:hypothetical protein